MRKFIKRFLYIITFFFLSSQVFSQNLIVGFGWGLINFQNSVIEKSGNTLLSYEVESDYHYSFFLKYIIPGTQIRFKGGYYNSQIKGAGTIININPLETRLPINARVDNSLKSLILGLEYLWNKGKFKPYLGLDMLFGAFDDADIFYEDKSGESIHQIYPSETRVGLGLSGGIGYNFFPGIELDINLHYGILNLLGKKDYEDNITAIDLTVSIMFGI